MTKKLVIIALISVVVLSYLFLFNMKATNLATDETIAFTKEGFTDSMNLNDDNKLVAVNGVLELYLDETTSYFTVINTSTGSVWESNPSVDDPWESNPDKNITTSALEKQKSTMEVSYFNEAGSLTTINNYNFSIFHPESINNDEGLRTYQIKYLADGFQILYIVEDIEIDYLFFPKFLDREVLEAIENRDVLEAIAYTGYDEETDMYQINQYENMSKLVKKRLYDVFYGEGGLGYTRDQAIAENALNGYNERYEKIRFEIGVEVKLNSEGITTSVINDSIVEPSNVKLGSISLYPLFGTAVAEVAGVPTEGYMVIPDGSGAVMEFNNGKFYQEPYVKRLYGEDIAILDYKMVESQQIISIPLYGMVKENAAFAAIITKGDAMATINADVSGRIDSYNKIFTSFKFRENESITLGSGFNQYGLDLWTEDRVVSDFTVEYVFLEGDEANYVGIAKVYQEYLINNFDLDGVDTTTETILTTEFVGSYDRKNFLAGIPYNSNESLTSFAQAEEILDVLDVIGVSNVNIIYSGMINGGLSQELADEFKVERSLGGNRQYTNFLEYVEENNIDFYPRVNLIAVSEYNRMFDQFRYTSSRIDGSLSVIFDYHLPSKLPYSETIFDHPVDDYVLSPLYFETVLDKFLKDYDENNLMFSLLGSSLGGDYNEDDPLYRQDTLRIQQEILSQLEEKTMLSNPLGFAIPYADYIVDLPSSATLYAILDYPIPLLQLVLSGKIDYATESLNLANERSMQYNFLKAIETGSNIKYSLSFDDSRELKDTKYNYYISTQYLNWTSSIQNQIRIMDLIGIHDGVLIDHQRLESNVFKVTYSHGLEIIINYNLNEVNINGDNIAAMSYMIVEVD